jgi:hypothetical protein
MKLWKVEQLCQGSIMSWDWPATELRNEVSGALSMVLNRPTATAAAASATKLRTKVTSCDYSKLPLTSCDIADRQPYFVDHLLLGL